MPSGPRTRRTPEGDRNRPAGRRPGPARGATGRRPSWTGLRVRVSAIMSPAGPEAFGKLPKAWRRSPDLRDANVRRVLSVLLRLNLREHPQVGRLSGIDSHFWPRGHKCVRLSNVPFGNVHRIVEPR